MEMRSQGGQAKGLLVWDAVGEHFFETGVDRVVLYVRELVDNNNIWKGYAWNGITAVEDNPEGAESNEQYADNILYLNLISAEKYKGVIKAFTFPDKFYPCIGMVNPTIDASGLSPIQGVYAGQQTHKVFGLSYRTWVGNDVDGQEGSYKIHLAYNLTAAPSQQAHNTVNDSPEAIEMSWDLSSVPMGSIYLKHPTSTLTFESAKLTTAQLEALEGTLYGSAAQSGAAGNTPETPAQLPNIDDLLSKLNNAVG